MRLLLFTLAIPFLLQPASAREHSGHHVWRHVSYHHASYRHDARLNAVHARGEYAQPSYEAREGHGDLDAMIARHAQMEGVPEALVHRVVIRESRYNPRAIGSGGAMGLMQIKYSTARAMGYTGSPSGLLDADTNLTYAVRYLAGAYRVAHGSTDRAVMNYARGYYDGAKREGFSPYQANAWSGSYASARPVERVARNRGRAWRPDGDAPGAYADRQLDAR
jgi:soluble lytic murein transglycosylase-like protein